MPLRRRLLILISIVLAACVAGGSALTYWHAVYKVESEISSALEVSSSTLREAISTLASSPEPERHLRRIVSAFDGERHLKAELTAPDGSIIVASRIKPPTDPAPNWLYEFLASPNYHRVFALPENLQHLGTIALEADPHNEVSEVWGDAQIKLIVVGGFCSLVLALVYGTLGWALRPLDELSKAFVRVGQGDFRAQVAEAGPEELTLIYKAFNQMTKQLQNAEQQNQRLNEQLTTVQEEERSEIARDLHDEIGPFLFAVDVDAQTIPALIERGAQDQAIERSKVIRQSVGHMQTHLRNILRRLRPAMLIDLGLHHAVDQLIAFWQSRKPSINFTCDVDELTLPAPIAEAAFRILQEGVSNAVRHGRPTKVEISAKRTSDGRLRVIVSDDGIGIDASAARGFGLAGMKERAIMHDGSLKISERKNGSGVMLVAELPIADAKLNRRPDQIDAVTKHQEAMPL